MPSSSAPVDMVIPEETSGGAVEKAPKKERPYERRKPETTDANESFKKRAKKSKSTDKENVAPTPEEISSNITGNESTVETMGRRLTVKNKSDPCAALLAEVWHMIITLSAMPLSVIVCNAAFNNARLIYTSSYPAFEMTARNARLKIPKRKFKTFLELVAKKAAYFICDNVTPTRTASPKSQACRLLSWSTKIATTSITSANQHCRMEYFYQAPTSPAT